MKRMPALAAAALLAAVTAAAQEPSFKLSGEAGAETAWYGENPASVFSGIPGAPPFAAVTASGLVDGKAVFSRRYTTLGLLDFTFRADSLLDHADGAAIERLSFAVNELYADLNFGDLLYLRLGKQRLKWGAGYVFNPSDPVNPPKDPTAARAVREGVTALKAERIGPVVSLMAFGVVYDAIEETGAGLRVSTSALPNTDLSLSGYWSASESWTAALNVSVAPLYELPGWDTLQLWLEGSFYDRPRYLAGAADPNPGMAAPTPASGRQFSLLAGATAQVPGLRTVALMEYYHLSEGFSADELDALYRDLPLAAAPVRAAWLGELARRPGRLGADHLFLSLTQPTLTDNGHPVLDRIGLFATCLLSLTDRSSYATGGIRTSFVEDSSVDLTLGWARGGRGTEFGNTPSDLSAGLAVKVYF